MASYKLNIAIIKGCPDAVVLASKLDAYGLALDTEFGIIDVANSDAAVRATLLHRVAKTVSTQDDSGAVSTSSIEIVKDYPFTVFPDDNRLEIYAGGGMAIRNMSAMLGSGLALPVVVEPREFDLLHAVEKLMNTQSRFQIKSARVSDHAASSYMIGPYAPKFMDTDHGQKFMAEHEAALLAVKVRFQGQLSKVDVTMSKTACFGYSCHEDDAAFVRCELLKLL